MDISAWPPAIASRYGPLRWRSAGYWLATVAVAAELGLGGSWDIARLPLVRDLVVHLGYPTYFLVLLGSWKVLGAVALLIPRRPLLKEWAYAGAFFAYTGAIASHLATGYDLGELGLLAVLTTLTVVSWALRPPSRRPPRRAPAAPRAAAPVPGAAHTIGVTGRLAASAGGAAARADAASAGTAPKGR
jgi:DoxX-like family